MNARHDGSVSRADATLRSLEILRAITGNPELTMPQMLCFLYVGQQSELPQLSLEQLLEVSQAAASRAIARMGAGWPRDPGYGLMESFEDPFLRRRKLVRLTPRGQEVMRVINEGLRPNRQGR